MSHEGKDTEETMLQARLSSVDLSLENYQNLTETVRNNTYFDSIELKTISTHSKTVTVFIFLSLFIFIMRFRFHKSKNVLFTIITRLNNNASSIIRNICSSLSAK